MKWIINKVQKNHALQRHLLSNHLTCKLDLKKSKQGLEQNKGQKAKQINQNTYNHSKKISNKAQILKPKLKNEKSPNLSS